MTIQDISYCIFSIWMQKVNMNQVKNIASYCCGDSHRLFNKWFKVCWWYLLWQCVSTELSDPLYYKYYTHNADHFPKQVFKLSSVSSWTSDNSSDIFMNAQYVFSFFSVKFGVLMQCRFPIILHLQFHNNSNTDFTQTLALTEIKPYTWCQTS